jgi:hypothetical protein
MLLAQRKFVQHQWLRAQLRLALHQLPQQPPQHVACLMPSLLQPSSWQLFLLLPFLQLPFFAAAFFVAAFFASGASMGLNTQSAYCHPCT